MNRPVVVVQLSDSHVGATWVDMDPVASLTAVIEQVRRLEPSPDAIVLSGDLAEHGSDSEYEQLAALLDAIEAPRYVLPGNHDDRDALRRHFGAPGAAGTPVQYAVDLGRLRILMLDSTRAGADTGQFDAERLGWIESALADDPGTPTLLAMHHPPLMTVAPAADAIGFPDADRAALADLVGRHRNVSLIVAGHLHRAIAGRLDGCTVLAAPSTYAGFVLDFADDRLRPVVAPPGYVVHAFTDGEFASHVETLRAG